MTIANVSLKVKPYRLLKKSEAASYCSRSPKTFETECAVRPIVMGNGDKLWDVIDLDKWIDGLKAPHSPTVDEWLNRLG